MGSDDWCLLVSPMAAFCIDMTRFYVCLFVACVLCIYCACLLLLFSSDCLHIDNTDMTGVGTVK